MITFFPFSILNSPWSSKKFLSPVDVSALTSLLFYLGVIQKVVAGMAWVLTKLLRISGAESLSVAGNIFLGQLNQLFSDLWFGLGQ